jgi:hypothetical protein
LIGEEALLISAPDIAADAAVELRTTGVRRLLLGASLGYDHCLMPSEYILALLIAERDKLNRAIEALQGLVKRRGRPPKNLPALPSAKPERKRNGRTAAQKKAQSARMKKYWAQKRRELKS